MAYAINLLRAEREKNGRLSRRKERLLKDYKQLLNDSLGATVLYSEDRQSIPLKYHVPIAFLMKDIDNVLKDSEGYHADGRVYHLMSAIFTFDVSDATIQRYYYMSEEERKLGK